MQKFADLEHQRVVDLPMNARHRSLSRPSDFYGARYNGSVGGRNDGSCREENHCVRRDLNEDYFGRTINALLLCL